MADIRAQDETALASVKAIYDAANQANSLLDQMEQYAEDAGTSLTGIYADAESAKSSATSASEYAARALGNLGTVQSVTETLNWITAHGTMTLTSDVALDPSHVYFVVDAQGDYVVGGTHYSVVTEPDVADISTYYELGIDESLNNYVATHLVVDSEGLWIIPDAGGNKVLIATGQGTGYLSAGTYIVSGSDVLAEFTSAGATIGTFDSSHMELGASGITATSSEGVEYFSVSEDGGQETYRAIREIGHYTEGRTSPFSIDLSATDVWGNINSGEEFDILVSFYYDNPRHYDSHWASFIKGTAKTSDVYATYDGVNTITITGAHPGTGTTYMGVYMVSIRCWITTPGSLYRFGQETAETGGANSFMMGKGTKATGSNQLAIGEYNSSGTNYAFIVGNGTSNTNRSNAFCVYKDGSAVVSDLLQVDGITVAESGIKVPRGGIIVDQDNIHLMAGADRMVSLFNYGDIQIALDTSASSGTDHDIYAALVALGWDSDVIV